MYIEILISISGLYIYHQYEYSLREAQECIENSEGKNVKMRYTYTEYWSPF